MIEKLFATLNDGKWHNINELSDQFKMKKDKLKEFFKFLSTQGIIRYEEETGRVTIEPEWQKLLPTQTEPPPAPKKSPIKPDAFGLKK
jgi:hypothetical protein